MGEPLMLEQAAAQHDVGPRRPRPAWVAQRRPCSLDHVNLMEHLARVLPGLSWHQRRLLTVLCLDASKPLGFACGKQTRYAATVGRTVRTIYGYYVKFEALDLIWVKDRQGTHEVHVNWERLQLLVAEVSGLKKAQATTAHTAGRTGKDFRSRLLRLKTTQKAAAEGAPASGESTELGKPRLSPAPAAALSENSEPREAPARPAPEPAEAPRGPRPRVGLTPPTAPPPTPAERVVAALPVSDYDRAQLEQLPGGPAAAALLEQVAEQTDLVRLVIARILLRAAMPRGVSNAAGLAKILLRDLPAELEAGRRAAARAALAKPRPSPGPSAAAAPPAAPAKPRPPKPPEEVLRGWVANWIADADPEPPAWDLDRLRARWDALRAERDAALAAVALALDAARSPPEAPGTLEAP